MSSSTCRSRFHLNNRRLTLKLSLAVGLSLCSSVTLQTGSAWSAPSLAPQAVAATEAAAPGSELAALEKQVEDGNATTAVIEKLGHVVERDPKNARAHFILGRALDMAGYASLAELEFRKADELDPTRPGALLELFQSKLDAEDRVGAYKLLGYMAYRFPEDPAVLYMQGLYEFSQGRNQKAEDKLNQALHSPRAVTGVKSMIAALRINQGRYADAIKLADDDLKVKPDHFYANLMKGQALFLSGHPSQAVPYLKKAYEERSTHPGIAELLSRSYQAQGFYADALEPALYQMALTTKQEDMERVKKRVAYLERFLNASQTANVAAMARRRLGGRAEGPRLYFGLADVLDRLGRRREAIATYEKGLLEDPRLARGWYRLARDFEAAGDMGSAAISYRKALDLAPQDTQIVLSALRFSNRLENSKRDVAWQIKQLLRRRKQGTVSSA